MLKFAAIAAAGSGLGVFDRLTEWATDHGYFAILAIVAGDGVFPLFPGETVIVAGGTLAATGDLALLGVILAGTLGAIIGDSTAYWLGRAGGEGIRRYLARVAGHDRVLAAERMVARRGPALVFVGRFLPGIRLAINLSCGAGQMDYKRFIIFDSLGALLWATQAAVLGYIFGKRFEDRPWIGLLIALGVALAVAGIVTMRERKHIRHEKEQAAAELARREAQDSTVSP
jgi:membrane protein DedA with SNARE-associated domain